MTGASASQTGPLAEGGAASSTASPAKPSVPSASRFISRIADRFQEMHTPPLARDAAIVMAVHTLEWVEDDTPFGDTRCAWDDAAAIAVADEEISYWESASDAA